MIESMNMHAAPTVPDAQLLEAPHQSTSPEGESEMFRIDHRVVRALLGALALYLVWHAVAPPFGDAGTPAQARMLMAFVAAVLIAALTTSLYMFVHASGPRPALAGGLQMRAHRPTPWRSRMASAHAHATDGRPASRESNTAPTPTVTTTSGATTLTVRRGAPDHVLVVCDGTSAGDSACRLAQRLTDRRQALVRAIAILPENVRGARPDPGEPGPIERFLDDVNDQMRRTTPLPGAWRLTLIVHDVESELRRACAEFDVDTILVPASLRTPEGDVLRAASAAVADAPRAFGRSAPLIVVVAEETTTTPVAPTQMRTASLRPDTAALAALSARPEPVRQP